MSVVVSFTDFGLKGPYAAQVEGAVYDISPDLRFINLIADAPRFEPFLASFLLAACANYLPEGAVFLCVVDPGVGTAERRPIVVSVDGLVLVGPDNGLFDALVNQASAAALKQTILWCPENLSKSFHGRDLFAPVAANLALRGKLPSGQLSAPTPYLSECNKTDCFQVIYFDDFGNAMTGVRASTLNSGDVILMKGVEITNARTFGDVSEGKLFWYGNSIGLVELAVNRGSARQRLELMLGDELSIRA